MIGTHLNGSLDPIHISILGKVSELRDLLLYMLQFTYLGPFYSVIPPSHRVSLSSRSNKKRGIDHTEGTFMSWKPWSQSGTYHFYSNSIGWWLVWWLIQVVIKVWVMGSRIESENVIIGLAATVQIQLYGMNEKTIYII